MRRLASIMAESQMTLPMRPVRALDRNCANLPSRLNRIIGVLAFALVVLLGPAFIPARAAPLLQAATDTTPSDVSHSEATVRYFNRDIVTFRSDLLGRPPAMRAKIAENNIDRTVAKHGNIQVSFKELPQGMLVMLGGELITFVTPDDLDKLNNETMADVRLRITRNLTAAVTAYINANSPRQLTQAILWSVFATLVAFALLVAIRWLGRRAGFSLQHWLERRLLALRHDSARQLAQSVRTIAGWLVRMAIWIVALAILEEWLRFVFGQFPFTQPWSNAMRGWVVSELKHWGSSIVSAAPGIAAAIFIVFIARTTAQAVSMLFRGVQSGRFKLFQIDEQLAEPTRKLVVAVIWLFAIAMAYPHLPGAQTDAFKGLSVLVGLMVSLGASGIVGQAASSFTILYSRTMKVGDLISSGSTEGTVLQIGLFTTRIRTLTGVEISIPNTVVLGSQLYNFSRHPDGPGMWLDTSVTIGYDTPWRQVQQMLLEAAKQTQLIETMPASHVLQTALSDFYVEYRLLVWITDVRQRLNILNELHALIQDNFNAASVQIMSPHYVTDPAEPKIVPVAR